MVEIHCSSPLLRPLHLRPLHLRSSDHSSAQPTLLELIGRNGALLSQLHNRSVHSFLLLRSNGIGDVVLHLERSIKKASELLVGAFDVAQKQGGHAAKDWLNSDSTVKSYVAESKGDHRKGAYSVGQNCGRS